MRALLAAALLCGAAAGAETMAFPGKDWQRAAPASQGVDAAKLTAAVAYLAAHSGRDGVGELVIVRNGRLIHAGRRADKIHGVWSLTKSFTSTVLGLLIDDGKCTLDTPAKDPVAELAASYPKVTLRHFATMTSGYRAVGDEPKGGYYHGPSATPFAPGKPLFAPPGSKYAYWDSAMNQFGHVLARIAGEPIERLFRRRIAGPIGLARGRWRWGSFGKVGGIEVHGGSGNANRHVFISARELARFGLLFLHRGRWGRRQLISEAWVKAATATHVPAGLALGHPKSPDGRGMYGLNWWTNGVKPNGRRKWPGLPVGAFAASGYNNNDLFVIPKWNLVVVRLGLDEKDHRITDAEYATFLRGIGKAIAGDARRKDE